MSRTGPDQDAGPAGGTTRGQRAAWLQWVARVWAEFAIVGYLLWQATTPAPVEGEGDYWERLVALGVVAIIVVGHLLSWRWEIQGATIMAVGGALATAVGGATAPLVDADVFRPAEDAGTAEGTGTVIWDALAADGSTAAGASVDLLARPLQVRSVV